MRILLPLLLAGLLGGCAGGAGCGAVLANASERPVEQFYLAPAGHPPAWGANQLAERELPPGASLPIRIPGRGSFGMRAVWADGQAAELAGLAGCGNRRVTVTEGGLRAE